MDDELLTLLGTSKIFSSLPKRAYKKILSQFEKTELEPTDILYNQGDPSDFVGVVLSGKLESILTTSNGDNKVVGEIDAGETVGEIGALSGEPRPTTIKAIKNSALFKLPSELFVELCHEYPSILFAIINPIVSRSQKMVDLISSEKFKKHIAIIAANNEVSLSAFSDELSKHVSGLTSLILLSEFTDELAHATTDQIKKIIDDAKIKNTKKIKQKIVYLLKTYDSNLAKFCFEKIEMIYVVADDFAPIVLNHDVLEKINSFKTTTKTNPELIILHDINVKMPRNTISWLKLTEFGLHHHIRLNHSGDFERLVRFIRNKAVGIVLSGGGTRGWAHAGAIKALLEAGIPIDAVGGVSVGAIVAASYALTVSSEETLQQFHEVIEASRYSVSWRNITWPAISLFNAKGLTTVLQTLYKDIYIEDLWLPYFCVSTNLAKNAEVIHQHGILWEKIRASVAIPGVIPPMLLEGELHFDGGLLNNLPSDIMRNLVGHRGNVIAVELAGYNKDEHKYNFTPILTFWPTLLNKLGIRNDYKFPRFIDTFLKSLLVGSSVKAQQNSLIANIFVNIDLSRFPMLHSNVKLENRIVDIGYETTMEQIKNRQNH